MAGGIVEDFHVSLSVKDKKLLPKIKGQEKKNKKELQRCLYTKTRSIATVIGNLLTFVYISCLDIYFIPSYN